MSPLSLILKPDLSDTLIDLANVDERQGKPCEAVLPLEQRLYYYPDVKGIEPIQAHVDELLARPECTKMRAEGRARIPLAPGQAAIPVMVRISDSVSGLFIVDTGASYVAISRKFADKHKIVPGQSRVLKMQTANGTTAATLIMLDSLAVQRAKATRVPAVIVDNLDGVDGLLGLSFLSRFNVRQANGVLEIGPR